ncbi:MAG: UDP-2,4-diacetamido-2,4,6-trideoxy-beta-L-altropyranose hydrolase [Acidobacteriota bacterium]
MISSERLLLRADADEGVGTGHVMRCLALAQAWIDAGGTATVAACAIPGSLVARLGDEGVAVERILEQPGSQADAGATAAMAESLGANRIVCDGYRFGSAYQRAVREAGSLLLIDDTGELGPYAAELVLNQNLHASEALYSDRASHTTLLLGPRYILLRREFLRAQRVKGPLAEYARRLLVTLGGSDPVGTTVRVVRALGSLGGDTAIRVLVGPSNPRFEELAFEAAAVPNHCQVVTDVGRMPSHFEWADLVVSGAGSTCWELAYSGVPFVTIALAENQRPIAKSLEDAGVSRHAGWYADLDEGALAETVGDLAGDRPARTGMASAGRALVDGFGAERVVGQIARAAAA